MIFVDWFGFAVMTVGVLIIAASLYGIRSAGKMPKGSRRGMVLALCLPLGAIASLALILLAIGSGCVNHSPAIYSPSGKMAVRIEDADEGATGGSTVVELFWGHGFREKTIFEGGWKSVYPSDIRWMSNTQLTIHYSGGYSVHDCASSAAVTVSCVER